MNSNIKMAKVNSSNENETKSDVFFMGNIQIWHHFSLVVKY